MIKPQNAYFVYMTPSLAQQWISEYRYEKQRALRQWRVNQHAIEMKEGRWIPGYPIQLCRLGDRIICTDGQHRQMAVIESGEGQMFAVIELQCDTAADVELVYYKTDRNITRTTADMYRATGLASELGLNDTQFSVFGAAVTAIASNFTNTRSGNQRITDNQRLELLQLYGESAGVYFETIANAPRYMQQPLKRAPVVGVGIATLHYSCRQLGTQRVIDFWQGMATGDGIQLNDPRLSARNHLVNTNLGNGHGNGKTVTSDYQARYIAGCFNKWAMGQFLASTRGGGFKVRDPKSPIHIVGTPWNGNEAAT